MIDWKKSGIFEQRTNRGGAGLTVNLANVLRDIYTSSHPSLWECQCGNFTSRTTFGSGRHGQVISRFRLYRFYIAQQGHIAGIADLAHVQYVWTTYTLPE